MHYLPREAILRFEEIIRIIRVASGLGIWKVRLTGGEPLLRRGLPELIKQIKNESDIWEVTLTTNGTLLGQLAASLKEAGLTRLNLSLDTLSADKFRKLTGGNLQEVLEGVAAALKSGFQQIKLNVVAIRDFTEEEVLPLTEFALEHGLEIRFVELMPLAKTGTESGLAPLPAAEILTLLESRFGPSQPAGSELPTAPARCYRFPAAGLTVGIIPAISQPFCDHCCRLRLTADGKLKYCLFADEAWDLRAILRTGGSDRELADAFVRATQAKWPMRPTGGDRLPQLPEPMHRIGG
jgi:cyclic pyranopterin phosphate synthase